MTVQDELYDPGEYKNSSKYESENQVITINLPERWVRWIDKFVVLSGSCNRSQFIRHGLRKHIIESIQLIKDMYATEERLDEHIEREGYVYIPKVGYKKLVRRLE